MKVGNIHPFCRKEKINLILCQEYGIYNNRKSINAIALKYFLFETFSSDDHYSCIHKVIWIFPIEPFVCTVHNCPLLIFLVVLYTVYISGDNLVHSFLKS